MSTRPRGKTNLTIAARTERVSELVKALESGRRLDWLFISRRYGIARENAYRWLRRAEVEFKSRPVGAEAVALAGSAARANIANRGLKNGVSSVAA